MKTAPSYLIAGLTAGAALAAGALLAAEDRNLFEPQHATVLLDVMDPAVATWAPVAVGEQRLPRVTDRR